MDLVGFSFWVLMISTSLQSFRPIVASLVCLETPSNIYFWNMSWEPRLTMNKERKTNIVKKMLPLFIHSQHKSMYAVHVFIVYETMLICELDVRSCRVSIEFPSIFNKNLEARFSSLEWFYFHSDHSTFLARFEICWELFAIFVCLSRMTKLLYKTFGRNMNIISEKKTSKNMKRNVEKADTFTFSTWFTRQTSPNNMSQLEQLRFSFQKQTQ